MIYSEFIDCENATIVIKQIGATSINPTTKEPEYTETEIYNNTGIFYEEGATENIAKNQIQKDATAQVILNPTLVTTFPNSQMKLFVTTDLKTDYEYRIITAKNPLNRGEAIIIDITEA